MSLSASSPLTNLVITLLVAALVALLPVIDRRVCKKLGLNVLHGTGDRPDARKLLALRKIILYVLFAFYMLGNAWVVFFSRSATADYQVHVDLMHDLLNSVKIDTGILGILGDIVTQGFSKGFSHIQITGLKDIAQVYMNIALYIPMGYLLPYVFDWFRQKPRLRPVLAGAACSFLTENLQLIFRRGFYDLDDLFSNILGAWIGQLLFLSLAYVVTHPDWRKELAQIQRWRKHSRKTLYPYLRRLRTARVSLLATDETAVWDFYMRTLGFRPIRQLVPEDSDETGFLMQLGGMQLEIRCLNRAEPLSPQTLMLQAGNLRRVEKRLRQHGIVPEQLSPDPYTGQSRLSFPAPDGVIIVILGK